VSRLARRSEAKALAGSGRHDGSEAALRELTGERLLSGGLAVNEDDLVQRSAIAHRLCEGDEAGLVGVGAESVEDGDLG
jgi:hypothetical protein